MLAVGGWSYSDSYLATAEVFNPATQQWAPAGAMSEPRMQPGIAALADGRVLVAGGRHRGNCVSVGSSTSEIFDPATNFWTRAGALSVPRGEGHVMLTLSTGQPAIVGGFAGRSYYRTLEIFDLASKTLSQSEEMGFGRAGHVAVALTDGGVLVAGGFGAGQVAERFRPALIAPPAPPAPQTTPVPVRGIARFARPLPTRLTATRAGRVTVKLRCGNEGPCTDRLVLRLRRTVIARADVRVAAGRTKAVRLQLSKTARRQLSRRTRTVRLELKHSRLTRKLALRR